VGAVLEILSGSGTSEELNTLKAQVETFTQAILEQYGNRCKKLRSSLLKSLSPKHTKNFYDSVWGTIEVNEGEILLIDSPLLQRLRLIKHLGLADLLYSSANHSRFSHTLGALHTADGMARQIEKELQKKGMHVDETSLQIVRLAALFHDCGHMVCSHASERFFQSNHYSEHKKIERIRKHFFGKLNIKPSLTEILSILMVQSKAVREFLSVIEDGFEPLDYNNGKQDVVIEKICCLIIGYPFSKRMFPYSQIICGQIDADKLDYLKRDSHATGVPVAVDMSRIFQKLRVVQSNEAYSMIASTEEATETVYKMAIAPAAINTIDQLVISRYMMYENIYYHPKTLIAEESLRYALEKLDQSTRGLLDNFNFILRLTDDIVVNGYFKDVVLNNDSYNVQITDEQLFNDACGILSSLNKRELFKRCIAFTSDNLTDVGYLEENFYSKIFLDQIFDDQKLFIERVVNETKEIKKTLKSVYCFNDATDILLLIAPDVSEISLNSNIAIAGKINKDRDMVFESDNWVKSRSMRKPQNYLISYSEDRYPVFIATEKVLLEHYGFLISDSVMYETEVEEKINEMKITLDKQCYYCNAFALAPNAYITRNEDRIRSLIKKWSGYERFDPDTGTRKVLNETNLKMFLKQFRRFKSQSDDFGDFINGCLDMLEQVRIVSKNDIKQTLDSAISKIIEKEHCTETDILLCNVGNLQDGSAQMVYQVNELNISRKQAWRVTSLNDLTCRLAPVVMFIEDAFFSANQILSIFETYMGTSECERRTKERHASELNDALKQQLKDSKLYFSFIFCNTEKEIFFKNEMRNLGLKNVEILSYQKFPDPYFKDNDDMKTIVRRYFEEAGKIIMPTKALFNGEFKENWNEERMEESILGYNNAQQLIVFSWNTPTYTLTPLWLRSKEWHPLFPRIDKVI
jgi:HD superfamily phosphohydrolase